MKGIVALLFALTLLAGFMGTARAVNEGACLKDEKKFCSDIPAGEDRKKKCMKDHLEQLSNACKANILDMMVKEKKAEK